MAFEKRAAQELLARRLAEVKAHTFTPDRQRLDFAALCNLFLASKVKARKPTLDGYGELINCYLRPHFGRHKVESITRFEVEAFRNEMAIGAPVAVRRARELRQAGNPAIRSLNPGARTTNKCLTLLVGIMGYAVKHGFASRNPAENMDKLPVRQGESRVIEQNVLTPAELQRVIDHAVDPYRLPIWFAVDTGARQAEAVGLQWGDVNWATGEIHIRRSWRHGAFYEPKTKASRRVVEVSAELLLTLKAWRLRCPKGDHDLVFPTASGRPMRGSDVLRLGFKPALRRAGLRQVRFHDLRHSFASNALANGVDVASVSSLLGHASPHVTMTVYAHSVSSKRHGVAEMLAGLRRGNNLETSPAKVAG